MVRGVYIDGLAMIVYVDCSPRYNLERAVGQTSDESNSLVWLA